MAFSPDDRPPTEEEDPLEDYPFGDVLHDYLLMADYFPQDDELVAKYRMVLEEQHGCLFVTTGESVDG